MSATTVPHLYDVKWSRDLNKVLAREWPVVTPYRTDTYLPGRSLQHVWMSHALPAMRAAGTSTAVFVNLMEDFSPDILKATGVKRVLGFVHGSNFLPGEPGATDALRAYEAGVASVAEPLVSTRWLHDRLPYRSTVVGLPVLTPRSEPRTGSDILWNHRLSMEKGVKDLIALPARLRERVVVTAPKFAASSAPKVRSAIARVYLGLPDADYMAVMDGCGYGLSTSHYDTFGYSVADGVMRGLAYFVPDTDETAYRETMPDALRYRDADDLMERIDAMDRDPDLRARVVREAQEGFANLAPDRWLRQLRELTRLA